MTQHGIYLDQAAATFVDERVLKVMAPYFEQTYANPGSLHRPGVKAKEGVDKAREVVARILNCSAQEIIFTSGGTESINLAIKGTAFKKGRGHIITSQIEHPAVLESCRYLEQKGFDVTYLNVDKKGLVSSQAVEKAIRKDTILITIMYANNEIGTLEPIEEIGKIAQKHTIAFHVDACQAGGLELDVTKLKVNLMTLNGSKIYGPKGVGILYAKSGIKLEPLFHGGGQEFNLRSGTENVPAIVGFAAALEIVQREKDVENKRLTLLRDYFIQKIVTEIPQTTLNGHPTLRLPNNINISFAGIEGEAILRYLDEQYIAVSTGSACSSNTIKISPVLQAIHLNPADAYGAVRFTLGKHNTKAQLDGVVQELQKIVAALRKISPPPLLNIPKRGRRQ